MVHLSVTAVTGVVDVLLEDSNGVLGEVAVPAGPHSVAVLGAPRIGVGARVVLRAADPGDAPIVATIGAAALERVTAGASVQDVLVAVYDLGRRPSNLSFLAFLLHAEEERRARGLASIEVLVLPEDATGASRLPADYRRAFPDDVRARWVRDLYPELARLVPAVRGVCLEVDRAVGLRVMLGSPDPFPDLASEVIDVRAPILDDFCAVLRPGAPRLSAPADARRAVGDWIAGLAAGRAVVTVSLRFEDYAPEINSDIAAWREAATQLDAVVVAVPDPRRPDVPVPDGPWTAFPWAGVAEIQALYEAATTNLASYGEAALPLLFSAAPFSIWVPEAEATPAVRRSALRSINLGSGADHAFLAPGQQMFYECPDPIALVGAAAPGAPG